MFVISRHLSLLSNVTEHVTRARSQVVQLSPFEILLKQDPNTHLVFTCREAESGLARHSCQNETNTMTFFRPF
jgi:hypothetical protein